MVSPAGPARADRVAAGRAMLESFGLRVSLGAAALRRDGFHAGSDEERLAALPAAFCDPAVDVVAATRGGYGTQRLLDRLDRDAIAASAAVFLGFSDLTALHTVLLACGRASLYAPALAWDEKRNGA